MLTTVLLRPCFFMDHSYILINIHKSTSQRKSTGVDKSSKLKRFKMALFVNQGSRGGDDDNVDDVRVEFVNQGSRGVYDDSVDDVWVESTPRRGCRGDGNNGGNSGVGGGDRGSAYSEDGVGSLGTDDDVCDFTRGDGMASPHSDNLFVDTAALSDQEHLQSALALFAKYPHLFKINSGT
jgi:hypothetical protein